MKRYAVFIFICISCFIGRIYAAGDNSDEFISRGLLISYGFDVVELEVETRFLISKDGVAVETTIGRYLAYINDRKLMFLERPSFARDGEVFFHKSLLEPFSGNLEQKNNDIAEETFFNAEFNVFLSSDLRAFSLLDFLNDRQPYPSSSQVNFIQPVRDENSNKSLSASKTANESASDRAMSKSEEPLEKATQPSDDIESITFSVNRIGNLVVTIRVKKLIEDYQAFFLSKPDRLVVDVQGIYVQPNEVDIGIGNASRLRIGQNTPEFSRFVFDLSGQVGYVVWADDHHLNVELYKDMVGLAVFSGKGNGFIDLKLDQSQVDYFYLSNPSRIVIDVFGETWVDATRYITIQNGFLREVRVSSNFHTDPTVTRIVLEGELDIGFHVTKHLDTVVSLQIHDRGTKYFSPPFYARADSLSGKTIVIDPGHGGTDPGAMAGHVKEKDIVLDVSLKFASLLQQYGAKVILTRSTDVFVTLSKRAEIANTHKADLFISIHANAFEEEGPHGIEIFYDSYGPGLAEIIDEVIQRRLGRFSRGVKPGRYYVLMATRMPAILVELGFITNGHDRKIMTEMDFAQRQAEALLEAVIMYYAEKN